MQFKQASFFKSLPLSLVFAAMLGSVAACDRGGGGGGYQQESGSQQQSEPAVPRRD